VSSGRRVHERYDRRLDVVVIHEDAEIACVSRNISLGGMLLDCTDANLPYGSKVRLKFHLPALREDANIEATVRWQREEGMGVQFGSLRAREVWALNQLFKEG
jgi:hypothetical protein